MVEGARLESAYTRKGIAGSNPVLSAIPPSPAGRVQGSPAERDVTADDRSPPPPTPTRVEGPPEAPLPGFLVRRPLLGVALGAVAISFAPVFVRAIDPHALGPTAIGLHRTALGAVVLALLALARGESLRPSRRALLFTALAGALFAGDLFVWHRSILRVGAGMATILGNTQVIWVALAGAAFLGERLARRFVLAVPLAGLGVALLTGVLLGRAQDRADAVGVMLGIGTGGFYAAYILAVRGGQTGTDRLGPIAHMAWTSAACAATLGLVAALEGETVVPPDPRTVASLVGVALVAQCAGWVTLATCIPRVPASRAALLLLLQPVFAMVWDVLLFGKALGPWPLVGSVLTLAAIYMGSIARYPAPVPRRDASDGAPS